MVTLAGIVAGTVPAPPLDSAFDSVTTVPPEGAALVSVTRPVEETPPTRSNGLALSALSAVADPPGVINSNACCPGLPGRSAKMFILNCDATGDVLIVKDAVVAPAGTVMLDGIVATLAGAGVESATTVAPLCGALNVIVPTAGLPPTTLVGLTVASASTGGGGAARTVRVRATLYRPSEAVTVTSVSAAGGRV